MNEEINYQINEINTYLKDLKIVNSKKDFLENREKKLATSMALFNILNASIEIGEIIISKNDLDVPLKYRDIFDILHQNKVISKDISIHLKKFVYHRNMLAHQYGKINFEELYELIENKDFFIKYIEEIKGFILKI